ncbi:MAG: glycerol-3-phosphate 1-O-acyltransferase [Proteobacteria bacterium]|nr:glycerol-3-phosphate 1-O-acyltransferase [Pseudomonadota bacterium]
MINIFWLFETFTFAYLLGSIPFGLILTRMAGIKDIRQVGSGNIGATNVMRAGLKKIGILTLLLDGAKGYAAVLLAQYMFNDFYAVFAGFFVVIGHVFTVWLRFKGGKGVATTIGVFFALDWMLGVTVCAMWLLAFYFMRISSVASILAICYSSIAAYLVTEDWSALLCLSLSALILFTHRSNIRRLLEGTEYSFGGRG